MCDQIMLFHRVRPNTHVDYAGVDHLASALRGDLGMGGQHQDFLKYLLSAFRSDIAAASFIPSIQLL